MKKRYIALIGLSIVAAAGGVAAYTLSPTVHDGNPGEKPELALSGQYVIGTQTRDFTLPGRSQISITGAVTGNLDVADRILSVRFWYPANPSQGKKGIRYTHEINMPGQDPLKLEFRGLAENNAQALTAQKFPLVLMSHGYGAWSTHFSNLAEHIASRGYVVASIDHADQVASGGPSFLISFSNVLVDRAIDQRQVLAQIIADASKAQSGYMEQIDAEHIGMIGYSMGGYGVLASAGADYDYSSSSYARLPQKSVEAMKQSAKSPPAIDAIVAIAPWGGAPDNRVWNAAGLAKIKQPALIISGNQDDVVDFENGVQWIFNAMKGSDRHMLVYREARHNVAGNAFDLDDNGAFAGLEFLREPVWRTDRLNQINQHFITAFLDLTLKGDTAKAAFLSVPVADSNKSNWPVSFGEQLNGSRASDEQPEHWLGFQRRWAVGMEMRAKKAGE